MGKLNRWARGALSKIGRRAAKSPVTRIGEKIDSSMRSALSGVTDSIKLGGKVRKIMIDKKWVEGTIGSNSYDTISKKLKKFYEDGDTSGADAYIREQAEKMRNQ